MTIFIWAIIGYAAGTLPSAWIVAVRRGRTDVLERVKREAGESDAHLLLQQAAGRAASIAAALDMLKAFTPVIIATRVAGPYEVAACAVAAVAGHCWPPYLGRFAGRGLSAAAGAFLAFMPVEMVIAGLIRVLGSRLKAGGLSSTIGFALIPLVAWWRGQPLAYLIAGGAINVLIFVRRLEGISTDLARGISLYEAALQRVVYDASPTR